ncbi:hypothetical protein BD310DRAFT_320406 [Dichomitus squalens]|uniref:Uncharacterized protein n=1 Tax=Dichomitus squalens TaxID=114155 RepID=A0A4Q9Q058_9APHY|nr:hypothetical protein BD310DRAFT_320406 [Dichomitus squalens]
MRSCLGLAAGLGTPFLSRDASTRPNSASRNSSPAAFSATCGLPSRASACALCRQSRSTELMLREARKPADSTCGRGLTHYQVRRSRGLNGARS